MLEQQRHKKIRQHILVVLINFVIAKRSSLFCQNFFVCSFYWLPFLNRYWIIAKQEEKKRKEFFDPGHHKRKFFENMKNEDREIKRKVGKKISEK